MTDETPKARSSIPDEALARWHNLPSNVPLTPTLTKAEWDSLLLSIRQTIIAVSNISAAIAAAAHDDAESASKSMRDHDETLDKAFENINSAITSIMMSAKADEVSFEMSNVRNADDYRGGMRNKNAPSPLPANDDGNTLWPMDIERRLSRLEGGSHLLQFTVAVVSAVLIGAAALVVGFQIHTASQISDLSSKVDALPDQINSRLMELNRTLSEAITAARAGQQQPTVVVIPEYGRNNAQPSTPQ